MAGTEHKVSRLCIKVWQCDSCAMDHVVRAPRLRLVQNLNFIDSGLDLYHGLILGLSFGTMWNLKCSLIVVF